MIFIENRNHFLSREEAVKKLPLFAVLFVLFIAAIVAAPSFTRAQPPPPPKLDPKDAKKKATKEDIHKVLLALHELTKVVEENNKDIREVKAGVQELNKKFELMQKDVALIMADVIVLKTTVGELVIDVRKLKQEIKELRGDVTELKGELGKIQRAINALSDDFATVKKKFEDGGRRSDGNVTVINYIPQQTASPTVYYVSSPTYYAGCSYPCYNCNPQYYYCTCNRQYYCNYYGIVWNYSPCGSSYSWYYYRG